MLEKLCLLNSASGDERAVREYIISQINGHCEYSIDALGSVIAFKKGKNTPAKKVMLCAHMDEVGFIITDITDDGYLKFSSVGGIDTKVVLDRVLSVNGIKGVVGVKPIHLMKDDEKNKVPKFKDLVIDIGAKSKDEALKYVCLGDYAYFTSDFVKLGGGLIKAKALDDRIGCMLLIELIQGELDYDAYFCFNVQEEIGLRGSKCTSYAVAPDVSVVLEATTAADLCNVEGGDRVCVLGDGPVISFMDNRTIYDKGLYKLAMDTAKLEGINAQTKTAVAGGNDAGAIQISGNGSRVLAISLPCRYIHSPSSVVNEADIESTQRLIRALLPKLYD